MYIIAYTADLGLDVGLHSVVSAYKFLCCARIFLVPRACLEDPDLKYLRSQGHIFFTMRVGSDWPRGLMVKALVFGTKDLCVRIAPWSLLNSFFL